MNSRPDIREQPARILIVDDERQNRQLLEVLLTAEGYRIQTASSGEEALALVAQQPPDLILLDIMMPVMDGYQVAARVKDNLASRSIPVIMVTALDDRDAMMRALSAGAEDFLTRPVDRLELRVRVRNLLRLKAYSDYHDQYSRMLEGEVGSRTAELVVSEARKGAILESAMDCVVAVDAEGIVTEFNRAAEQTFGYNREDVLGKPMAPLLIPETRREEHYAGIMRYKDTGKSKYLGLPQDLTAMRADGTEFPISISVVPLRAPGVTGFLAVIRDVTESKQLQAQFLQAQKMESVGRLAGGVAHDFNNMLTAILGYAELTLLKLGAGHAVASHVEEILKAGQRSASLTRQLLAFARKETIASRVLDLNEAIGDILKMLCRVIGENVRLVWVPGSALWNVKADAAQIDQVLANLAVNARDAMTGPDARLEIATSNVVLGADFVAAHPGAGQGEFVRLRVADNGSGMDAHTLANIFEPFFTTKIPGQGTGLGLSTVYGVMKQHHGYIDVESTPGVGTTFHLYFPRTADGPEAAVTGPVQAMPRGGETILLVDDEESVRTPVAEMLRYMGYQVLPASGGADAVALAESHTGTIHLLLTDVIMPGMNGAQLRDELLKQRPGVKVLFMSGYAGDVVLPQGVVSAGTNFLQKPITLRLLADAVRRSLDGTSAQLGEAE